MEKWRNLHLKNWKGRPNTTITYYHAGNNYNILKKFLKILQTFQKIFQNFQNYFLNILKCQSEFINLLTTEEIPDDELFEIFNTFDCDGKNYVLTRGSTANVFNP